jgi:hypothetical protein
VQEAVQIVHCDDRSAAHVQSSHAVSPEAFAYLPSAQGVHPFDGAGPDTVPAAHASHVPASYESEYRPTAQSTQLVPCANCDGTHCAYDSSAADDCKSPPLCNTTTDRPVPDAAGTRTRNRLCSYPLTCSTAPALELSTANVPITTDAPAAPKFDPNTVTTDEPPRSQSTTSMTEPVALHPISAVTAAGA